MREDLHHSVVLGGYWFFFWVCILSKAIHLSTEQGLDTILITKDVRSCLLGAGRLEEETTKASLIAVERGD